MAVVEFYAFSSAFPAVLDFCELIEIVPICCAEDFEIVGVCFFGFEEFVVVFVVVCEVWREVNCHV